MRSNPRLAISPVAVVAGMVALFLALQAWELAAFARRQIGIYQQVVEGRVQIVEVIPDSPADQVGLDPGDVILALDGNEVKALTDVRAFRAGKSLEEPLHFVVERDGVRREVTVTPGAAFPGFTFTVTVLSVLANLAIGPLALAKRPGYLRARLLFWLTAAIALELALPGTKVAQNQWLAATVLLNGFQMAVELHLASTIPERQAWLTRRPWVIRGYYWFGLSLSGVVAIALLLESAIGVPLRPWAATTLYGTFTSALMPLWALAVLGLLGRQALTYAEPRGRQQAALVAAGVLPWALVTISAELGLVDRYVPSHLTDLVWNVSLLFYPLAVFLILWRETATQERILLELTDEVQRVGSVAEISRVVAADLHAAFHPKGTHVFYRQRYSRDLTLGHSSGPQFPEEQIPEASPLLRTVEEAGRPLDWPSPELAGLPDHERAWLDRLETRLVVPVMGRDARMLGLLLLGEKKSEEAYTPHDRRLLTALTGQIALVYENLRLKDRVDQSQEIERQVLARMADQELNLVKECPKCGRCYDASDTHCADDGADLQLSRPVERLVAGRYRLDRLVDKGGMGAIYQATDTHLGREVAIKVLHGSLMGQESARRFESEARLTATLRHPNVVTVHDYGTTNTGNAFLAMELLSGFTLKAAIKREKALRPEVLADWLAQACEGVAAAHRAHVIHRDLKPANVYVTTLEDGRQVVKILDFGIAKVKSAALADGARLTVPGMLLGTFSYMAPEQLQGGEADERSDIFALGVMAIEALTGKPPFAGDTPVEVLDAIAQGKLRLRSTSEAEQQLRAVLGRAVAFAAEARQPSVTAFAAELVPALRAVAAEATREGAASA
jgi:GAF domain-containing protein